jgi:hypothetical protein
MRVNLILHSRLCRRIAFFALAGKTIKNFNDMRVGDVIEAFEETEVKRTL